MNDLALNYTIVLKQGSRNWSAYVPDLPGCVAAGVTRKATECLIREAVAFHVEGILLDGMPLPEPQFDAGRGAAAAEFTSRSLNLLLVHDRLATGKAIL